MPAVALNTGGDPPAGAHVHGTLTADYLDVVHRFRVLGEYATGQVQGYPYTYGYGPYGTWDVGTTIDQRGIRTDGYLSPDVDGVVFLDDQNGHYYRVRFSGGTQIVEDLGTTQP